MENGTFSLFLLRWCVCIHLWQMAKASSHCVCSHCVNLFFVSAIFAIFSLQFFPDKLRSRLLYCCLRHLRSSTRSLKMCSCVCVCAECTLCDSNFVAKCSWFPFLANYNYTIITFFRWPQTSVLEYRLHAWLFWSSLALIRLRVRSSVRFGLAFLFRFILPWNIINNSSAKVQLFNVCCIKIP